MFLFCGSAVPAALPTKLSVVLILELIETPFNSMFAAVPTFNAVAEYLLVLTIFVAPLKIKSALPPPKALNEYVMLAFLLTSKL